MRDSLSAALAKAGAAAVSVLAACSGRRVARNAVIFGAFAALCAGAAPAQAHGRLGAAEGRCRLYVGPDIMNFTGYLPEASKSEFCEDIPSTGPMIMVLDAEQEELRDMLIDIRIVKDVGGEEKENENLEAVTVAHQPPKIYRTGTVNFEHDFADPGYFVGIVTVTGHHGERWVSRFPFSVGKTFMRDLPVYATLALGVIAASIIYLVHRRRQPPPALVTAAAAFKAPPPLDPPTSSGDVDAPAARAEAPEPAAAEKPTEPDNDKHPDKDPEADDVYRRQAAE